MTVFRFRNDSPVIPRPLHNSATKRSTTLPIELINDQRDMSAASYKNAKYLPLRGNKGKRHTTSLKLCNIKLDYTSRLMGVNTAEGHASLLCIVRKTLTETGRVKKRQKYRDAQSHVISRFHPLPTRQQQCQRHESFRKFQKKTYRDQQNVCSRQNYQSRVTFDTPKPDARTTFKKDGEKHGQREMLQSGDIRQVPDKRRVEVQSQNRDSLMRDVCTCLACPKTFPRSLTTLEETR